MSWINKDLFILKNENQMNQRSIEKSPKIVATVVYLATRFVTSTNKVAHERAELYVTINTSKI